MTTIPYRSDIDGLRALAVLAVVFFHLDLFKISGGFIGVDVFFVISGFLITSLLIQDHRSKTFSLGRFYQRRIQRILPALCVVMLVSFVVACVLLFPQDLKYFGEQIFTTSLFSSNVLYWTRSGYFEVGADYIPLLHTWSLAVEEQYYIFFPFLFLVFKNRSLQTIKRSIIVLFLLSFAASLWAMAGDQKNAAFYLLPFRAWELLAGAALAVGIFPVLRHRMICEVLSVIGIGMILFSVFAYTPKTSFPGFYALLPVLGAGMVIYAGMFNTGTIGAKILSHKIPIFFGKISYSLYLWHWPMIVLFKYITPWKINTGWAILLFGVCTGLSYLTWKYVEQPARQQQKFSVRTIFVFAFTGIIMFTAAGIFIFKMNGLPQRYPDIPSVYFEPVKAGKELPTIKNLDRDGYKGVIGPVDGRARFILWGDSHAYAALPGLDLIAKEKNMTGYFLGYHSCPPAFAPSVLNGDSCNKSNQEIAEFIKAHPEIKRIILAARWSAYEMKSRKKEFSDGIKYLLEGLKKEGHEIVILTELPMGRYENLPFHMLREKIYGYDEKIAPVLEHHEKRQKNFQAILTEISKSTTFKIVDIAKYICPKEPCPYAVDGRSLYEDTNHISTFGSEYFKDMYRPAFD